MPDRLDRDLRDSALVGEGFYNTRLLDVVARGVAARPDDLPPTVKTVMLTGEYMNRHYHGRYYAKAQNMRPALVKTYDDVLAEYDVLVMPTVPFRATPIPPPDCPLGEYLERALNMSNNTSQFDATGHPSISVPCGMEDNLPTGMMITGRLSMTSPCCGSPMRWKSRETGRGSEAGSSPGG